jgi:hypothetical protein
MNSAAYLTFNYDRDALLAQVPAHYSSYVHLLCAKIKILP